MRIVNRLGECISNSWLIAKDFSMYYGILDFFDSITPKKYLFGKKITRYRYEKNKKLLKMEFYNDYSQKNNFDNNSCKLIKENCTIWLFWWQGIERAPEVVKKCFKSVQKYSGEHPIIVIDSSNVRKYASIPEHIYNKVENGQISLTHFSDILRAQLLFQHGGIWMDSTLFMSRQFPKEMYQYPFYTIHHGQRSDYHVCKGKWTGFFLASGKNNPLFAALTQFFYKYWEKHSCLLCYLLIDSFLAIEYENNENIRKMIDSIPINNTHTLDFEKYMSQEYDKKLMNELCEDTYLHKLTYKLKIDDKYENMYRHLVDI